MSVGLALGPGLYSKMGRRGHIIVQLSTLHPRYMQQLAHVPPNLGANVTSD